MPRTYPCLWFDTRAEEAAEFYTGLFPNSKINAVTRYPAGSGEREGTVLTVEFELDGAPYLALNGGPEFTFDEAISITIDVKDQAELDHYWDALTADGGEESMCGWLKDKFGLSWQVVPEHWDQIASGDPERAAKVFAAMMTMRKLDIAALEAAGDA
ncbi:VOC family protein [Pedococcus ginsenosidimutans]|uniref:VOC family protein n=1 Tax=Pedococcus ginsenosidimutans TaxID=490570 RepID=A0ABP8Y3H8_9MICO